MDTRKSWLLSSFILTEMIINISTSKHVTRPGNFPRGSPIQFPTRKSSRIFPQCNYLQRTSCLKRSSLLVLLLLSKASRLHRSSSGIFGASFLNKFKLKILTVPSETAQQTFQLYLSCILFVLSAYQVSEKLSKGTL